MNLLTSLLKRIFRFIGEALVGKQEKVEYAPIRVKANQQRFPRK
jgi:hypothetical protein